MEIMATIKQKLFEEHIVDLQDWMESIASAQSELSGDRNWCILKLDKSVVEKTLKQYFDRTSLGEDYAKEFEKTTDSGPPFAFLQRESDLIYSMHRCFATRYRSRLMTYRDDCAQKNYHSFSAISLGTAKYVKEKESAEETLI